MHITADNTFDKYNLFLLTGNVWVRYDSSLYMFLVNLTHDRIMQFIIAFTIMAIAKTADILFNTLNKAELSTNEHNLVMQEKISANA